MNKAILDTGPIVALFNKNDILHPVSINFIKNYKGALYSNLAVITEVSYLLDFSIDAQIDFLKWIERGAINLVELKSEDFLRISNLMDKYRDLPMDFADGSIIVTCEKIETKDIVTIDSDFGIYRYQNKIKFRNLFPQTF
ncbi:MAG: type II toxin-antitoxin system VapC family toxin [bacterium]